MAARSDGYRANCCKTHLGVNSTSYSSYPIKVDFYRRSRTGPDDGSPAPTLNQP